MNRNIIIGFLAALLLASRGYQKKPEAAAPSPQGAGKDNLPLNAQLIGSTPIKNQGKSELCWAYGMLATIESEHIMRADSVNLSPEYVFRKMLVLQGTRDFFARGTRAISLRGMAPMLIGMLFLGSVQIFFIGLLGEYILSINQRVMRRPLVVEEERLNFPEDAMIGGMADAIYQGVHEAVIIDGRVPHSILLELFSDRGSGTRFYRRSHRE